MAVASPESITAAYNARDEQVLMQLYSDGAVHTFDGTTVSSAIDAVSTIFDRAFAGATHLSGGLLCRATADTALWRVRWPSLRPDGHCEVLRTSTAGLWRYRLDEMARGSRSSDVTYSG